MLKVFGNPYSTCTRKVLTVLHEKGAAYEFVNVDLTKGAQKSPEHLARQPFGVVPAIDDGGFALYESRAIIRYLNDKLPGTSLVPSDLKARAVMEQMVSVEFSYFTDPTLHIFLERVFHPMIGMACDEAKVAEYKTKSEKVFDILDKHLAGKQFMAGSEFTLADICYMPYVEYLFPSKEGAIVTSRKNVATWWETVSSRPSWKKATTQAV